MIISKSLLVWMGADSQLLKRFIEQTNGVEHAVNVLSLIGGNNTVSDLLWLAGKTVGIEKIVEFACKCALKNIEIIKPYTDTNNFGVIKTILTDPSSATGAIAWEAAEAASAAIEAAYDDYAYDVASAAESVADAAYAVADAVQWQSVDIVNATVRDKSICGAIIQAIHSRREAGIHAAAARIARRYSRSTEINELLITLFSDD